MWKNSIKSALTLLSGYQRRQVHKISPLEGIRVLDLSRILADPFCTQLLGDLGAEIIKVERPGEGDETRRWGPPFVNGESCYFFCANRNKKSVAINMQKIEGRNIIKRIAETCDIVIENFVPGKLEKFGLGYEDLKAVNSKLIYLSLTGYGSEGKYKDRAGYDVIAASMGGLLHITGPKDGDPCKVGVAVTDLATGLYAKGAILAALLQRVKTGTGQKIECDLLSTQVSLLVNMASNYLNGGKDAARFGTAHASIVPYKSYKTKSGYITVGGASEKQYAILCRRLGLDHLIDDQRFKTNSDRVKNRDILDKLIGDRFLEKTNGEWLEIFEGCGIPYGPINSIKEVFEDEEIYNRMVVQVKHKNAENIKVVGPAVKYSGSVNRVRSPPPLLGEHTTEVLSEFYTNEQIQEFMDNKIIS